MLMTYDDFSRTTPMYTNRQLDELRKKLRAEGCTWPLMKWRGFLADDSRIYNICEEENIPYSTQELLSTTVPEAIRTIIYTMLSRGKLTPFQRCEILLNNKKHFSSVDLAVLAGVTQEDFILAEQLIFLEDEESLIQAIENRLPIRKIFQNLMDRCDLEELRNDLRVFLNNFYPKDKKSWVVSELRKLMIKHEIFSEKEERR